MSSQTWTRALAVPWSPSVASYCPSSFFSRLTSSRAVPIAASSRSVTFVGSKSRVVATADDLAQWGGTV